MFAFASPLHLKAQSVNGGGPIPKVYLDCSVCDFNYIRTTVSFVDYVRDQADANIYLRIQSQPTSGGGREYTLFFIPQFDRASQAKDSGFESVERDSAVEPPSSASINDTSGAERGAEYSAESEAENGILNSGAVSGISKSGTTDAPLVRADTIRFTIGNSLSSDEKRIELNRYIKLGLIPFVLDTDRIRQLDVLVTQQEDKTTPVQADPWNGWTFDIDARASFSGEKSRTNRSFYGSMQADRITELWKIRGRVNGEQNRQEITLSDGIRTVDREWNEFWTMAAYSLSEHLSVGLFGKVGNTTYGNLSLYAELSPAVEYNVFPYREYQNRRFLIVYRLLPAYQTYYQTTIFNKDRELRMKQSLSANLRYDQRWGRLETSVSGSHYLSDFSSNRLNLNTGVNVRVARGLSVNVSARYSLINDQITLPGGDVNDEDNLLNLRQQATSYSYGASFGFSYTFGSIFNNVVNPRF